MGRDSKNILCYPTIGDWVEVVIPESIYSQLSGEIKFYGFIISRNNGFWCVRGPIISKLFEVFSIKDLEMLNELGFDQPLIVNKQLVNYLILPEEINKILPPPFKI